MERNLSAKDRLRLWLKESISIFAFQIVSIFVVELVTIITMGSFDDYAIISLCVFATFIGLPLRMAKDTFHENGSRAMKMMKCKVIDVETGEKPSGRKLVRRNLLQSIPIFWISLLRIAIKKDGLTIDDIRTNTRVVYIDEESKTGSDTTDAPKTTDASVSP